MAASLREIIAKEGDEKVAAKLGFSEVYMRHIRMRARRASANVMEKALECFGPRRVSVEKTLADNALVPPLPPRSRRPDHSASPEAA